MLRKKTVGLARRLAGYGVLAGGILVLTLLLSGAGLRAQDPQKNDDPMKPLQMPGWNELEQALQKLQAADTFEEKRAAQKEVMKAMNKIHQQLPFGPGPRMWGLDPFDPMRPFGAHFFFAPKPRFGVALAEPGKALADQLDLPQGKGLVVLDVIPGSAADKGGLKVNDILLQIDGKDVPRNPPQFNKMVADIKEDAAFDVVVLRKGKEETLKDLTLPKQEKPRPPFGPGVFGPGVADPNGVQMSVFRTQDRFTGRFQEGKLTITVTGSVDQDNKTQVEKIEIQDGAHFDKHNSIDEVPAQYREKVNRIMDAVGKGSVQIPLQDR